MRFMYMVSFIMLMAVLFAGCVTPEVEPEEQAAPATPEFACSTNISAPPILINGGNLQWHRQLPESKYTLEVMAVEVYNFGDFDILVTRLEVRVDGNSRFFNIDMAISGGTRENLVIQPMMAGYDGGTHVIGVMLLGEDGKPLCDGGGCEVGPLEPVPGTGSWEQVQSH